MNMYKLMIVDDEQIVIDAITHIINKTSRMLRLSQLREMAAKPLKKRRPTIRKSF